MMDIYLTGVLTSAWGHREGACFCGGVLIKMFAGKYNTDSKKQQQMGWWCLKHK